MSSKRMGRLGQWHYDVGDEWWSDYDRSDRKCEKHGFTYSLLCQVCFCESIGESWGAIKDTNTRDFTEEFARFLNANPTGRYNFRNSKVHLNAPVMGDG